MDKKNKKITILIGAIVLIIIAVVVIILINSGHRVIKVQSYNGNVTLERGSKEKDIVDGMNLKSEDTVTTGADGLVELLVDADKHILAQENTCFSIVASGNDKKGKLKIKLEYGTSLIEIENKLKDGSSVELETPNAALSVIGTTFEARYYESEETTVVKVTDGVVKVESDTKAEDVPAGYMATVKDDEIKIEALPVEYIDGEAFEARYSVTDEYSAAIDANAPENTGVDNESVGASIGESEWPELLKGGSNYSQLEHMLRIAQIAKNEGHSDYLKTALYYMCYETSITNVYEPISLTAETNGIYDISVLNNMYSFLTDETIGEEHLNPPSTISGNQLTCVYTPTTWQEIISSVTISNAYYSDNGEIIVEYIYYKTDITAGSVESSNGIAHLVLDEDGKYMFDYIE